MRIVYPLSVGEVERVRDSLARQGFQEPFKEADGYNPNTIHIKGEGEDYVEVRVSEIQFEILMMGRESKINTLTTVLFQDAQLNKREPSLVLDN